MYKRNQAGVTLVEIVTVLCIIAVFAAIATPSFSTILPNIRLRSAAMDLHSNMQKMRIQAIRTHRTTAVIFDTAENGYAVCNYYDETASHATATKFSEACDGATQIVELNDYKSGVTFGSGDATSSCVDGVSIPSTSINFTKLSASSTLYAAVFNNTGLGNPGQVYLENKNQDNTFAVSKLPSGIVQNLQWQGGSSWQ